MLWGIFSILALALASELGTRDPADVLAEARDLEALPEAMEETLRLERDIAALARRFALSRAHWAVVGTGASKIAADEVRIKLSELCYKSIAIDHLEDKKHIDLSSEPLIIVCAHGMPEECIGDAVKEVAIFRAHNSIPIVITEEGEDRFDPYAAGVIKLPAYGGRLGYLLEEVLTVTSLQTGMTVPRLVEARLESLLHAVVASCAHPEQVTLTCPRDLLVVTDARAHHVDLVPGGDLLVNPRPRPVQPRRLLGHRHHAGADRGAALRELAQRRAELLQVERRDRGIAHAAACARPAGGPAGFVGPPPAACGKTVGVRPSARRWLVVVSLFVVTYGISTPLAAYGVFLPVLAEEFGWSRASLSGVFSLYAAAYAFFGLFAGRLTDRWGPRAVVALGGSFLGLGLGLSAGVHRLAPLYATYLLAAVGMSTAYVPCTATVARWFAARRGLAVGLAMSGASLGAFVLPPMIALLLAAVGWRWAYVTLGAGLALSLGLLARLFVRDPRDRGLRAHGASDLRPLTATTDESAWPLGRIVRHRSFALLVAAYMMTWTPVFMPPVHLVPLARDLGRGENPVAQRVHLGAIVRVAAQIRHHPRDQAIVRRELPVQRLTVDGVQRLRQRRILHPFGHRRDDALRPAEDRQEVRIDPRIGQLQCAGASRMPLELLGHAGYLLFYLTCGVAASLAHLVSGPNSTVPTIGARLPKVTAIHAQKRCTARHATHYGHAG